MEIWGWVTQNAFNLISAVGIIGGLIFTAVSFRSEAKTRRVANLIALTQNHRELWQDFYKGASLARFYDARSDVNVASITLAERTFFKVMIQHLASVHRAMKSDLTVEPEAMREDVRAFFRLPIPKLLWEKSKPFQDSDFAAFVEGCLNG